MNTVQNSYKIFAKLLNERKITPYRVYKDTGVPQSSLSEWKRGNSMPKIDKMLKIADYFGVSVDFLMGVQKEKPTLTKKDERDIARTIEGLLDEMSQDGTLMFDGNPMSEEAKESIRAAMKLGLEAAKVKNKERFTPKKYRK